MAEPQSDRSGPLAGIRIIEIRRDNLRVEAALNVVELREDDEIVEALNRYTAKLQSSLQIINSTDA